MPNGTYGGVRGRKTKVGRKLSFSSYSIILCLREMFLLGLDLQTEFAQRTGGVVRCYVD